MKVVVIAIEVVEVENNLIDKYGKPYIGGESFPAGGGLDKRCTYNGDALYCYYNLEDKRRIGEYLRGMGWGNPIHSDDCIEIWEKGDTRICFDTYSGGQWGYVHTEFVG